MSFKEAGLGDNQLIDYRASADATATYVCVTVNLGDFSSGCLLPNVRGACD